MMSIPPKSMMRVVYSTLFQQNINSLIFVRSRFSLLLNPYSDHDAFTHQGLQVAYWTLLIISGGGLKKKIKHELKRLLMQKSEHKWKRISWKFKALLEAGLIQKIIALVEA